MSDRVVIAVVRCTLACLAVLGAACAAPRAAIEHAHPGRAAAPAAPPAAVSRYRLSCRDHTAPCPDGVGLLVRPADPDAERCTAVLVAPDRVLTASHCLAPSERSGRARCEDVWIGFAGARGGPMEWASCAQVVAASDVDDRHVMRTDVALLELTRRVDRTTYPIDARPPEPGSIVSVLAIRPHPLYPRYHELDERLCRVATTESAVATFGPDAAHVGWLMDCPSYGGNSGSPVLDVHRHVRSLLHAGSAPADGVGVTSSLAEP